jgi:NADH-quinone oxidoreductase subunit G
MPKFTLDGREIVAKDGQTIIEAATAVGVEIPHYCWHPKLSIAANCRMCLVEVEGIKKLQPACEARVREGMVVRSEQSKQVLEARESVMEFLLINHPIDCPICDQAGECKLQNYYMAHDGSGTRFDEVKVVKDKAAVLGPMVMLDEERCVNCTRCVRFMDEVAKTHQLGQFDRGDRAVIGVFPGQPLDHPYSGNTVDICPVGALTSTDFRFKMRPWFAKKTETLCAGCARGCNVTMDHNSGQIVRIKPRDNDAVNESWMCDDGRLTYHRVHDVDSMITEPFLRKDGKLKRVGWDEARRRLQEVLAAYVGASDGKLGLALSSQITNEGGVAFIELAEQILQVDNYAILGRPDWKGDELLKVDDQNPNRAGLELVLEAYSIYDEGAEALRKGILGGSVSSLIMVGSDYPSPNEEWAEALSKLQHLVVFASNWDDTSRKAEIVIPMASHVEQDGTFLNHTGRLQRVNEVIEPISGRKRAVEAAAFTAAALGAAKDWRIHTWRDAFFELKKRAIELKDLTPDAIGRLGVPLGVGVADESVPLRPSNSPGARAP